jgi:apolipoprotein N-acyltransferase
VALARRGVPRFLAYATGVYLALFAPGLFPWTPAGGLTPWPVLVQTADVIGERGTSLLVAIFVGMLAEAQRTPASRRKLVGAAALVASVMLGYGALRLSSVEASRLEAPKSRIALVQPGTGATMRWDPQAATRIAKNLHELTKSAEARGVDLVVWPEAAFPYSLSHASRRSSWGDREVLGGGIHGPVIVGLTLQKSGESSTNSALVARGDGSLSAPYDKRHLLAFGEAVPLADEIPWLKKTFARGTGLEPGKEGVTLEAGDVRAGVLICYEDNLPAAGREAMRDGGPRQPDERRVVLGQRGGRAAPAPRGAARGGDASRSRARREPRADLVRRRDGQGARALRRAFSQSHRRGGAPARDAADALRALRRHARAARGRRCVHFTHRDRTSPSRASSSELKHEPDTKTAHPAKSTPPSNLGKNPYQTRSSTTARPWPPPMHALPTP